MYVSVLTGKLLYASKEQNLYPRLEIPFYLYVRSSPLEHSKSTCIHL